MSGINKVILLGRLGQDPETKTLEGGNTVTNFSVATSEKWTDKGTGEIKEKTEWHRISVFGKLAELSGQYLKKGRQVYVEGKLKTRTYEKDGVKQYATDIIGDRVEFLGEGKSADAETVGKTAETFDSPATFTPAPKPAPSGKKPHNYAPGATNDEPGF